MQEIVAKANAEGPTYGAAQRQRPSSKYDSMKGKEIETTLNQKDRAIKKLDEEKNKFINLVSDWKSKYHSLKQDNERLETRLLDTSKEQRVAMHEQTIVKLKADINNKATKQKRLEKAIQELNMKFIKYESEKTEAENEKTLLKDTDKASKDLFQRERNAFDMQLKIAKSARDKALEDAQNLKV